MARSKMGFDAKIFRLTTGTRASWAVGGADGPAPSNLSEITNVMDNNLGLESDEVDVTTRALAGWKGTQGGLKNGSVEFQMLWDPTDTHFTALQAAWLAGTNVALAVLDGDQDDVGSQGLWADFQVISFTRGEPIADKLTASVVLKPGVSSVAPQWVTVTT